MRIPLLGCTNKFAVIDEECLSVVASHKWYLNSAGYAASVHHRKGCARVDVHRNVNVAMHRLIMGEPPHEGLSVDHADRDRLNNRINNLRWATPAQNAVNKATYKVGSSAFKGVSKTKEGYWSANFAGVYYGTYELEEEAALVYDKAARAFDSEFAWLNFPDELYTKPVRFLDYAPDFNIKSDYEGVSYFRKGGKRVKRWRAIHKKRTLGYFLTEEEAHVAWEAENESCKGK